MRPLQIEAAAKAFWEAFHEDGSAGEWNTADEATRAHFRRATEAALESSYVRTCVASGELRERATPAVVNSSPGYEVGNTTDRNNPGLRKIKPDGQQESYLVLSAEERAKGFVRPVRQEYRHLLCGGRTTMGLAIAETYARDPKFYGGTFCCVCGKHFPLVTEGGVRSFQWVETSNGPPLFVGE